MDEQTIQAKIAQARAMGIPEDQIQAKVAEIRAGAPPEVAVRQGLAGQIGSGIINFGKNLIRPEIDIVKKTADQLAHGTVPTQNVTDVAAKAIGPASTLLGIGNLNKEIRPAALNAASFAVPMSKGAGAIAGSVLPGAAMGAMQEGSQGGSLPDIIGGAIIGGSTAGLVRGAGAVAEKALGKAAGGTEEIGSTLRNANRKITVKPSVYGASKEKAISQTLDDLGVTGTPQEQYAQLQSKMSGLGEAIDEMLQKNPKKVSIEQVRNDFLTNLKSSLRTKEITTKQANKEIQGYLADLYAGAGGELTDTIDTPSLFKLKKDINMDYQQVKDKIERGIALSPREKVVSAARQTVDDIISNAHPEVKKMTVMQSHLYDAAPSLAKARQTPPVFRVAGTSVPSGITQTVVDKTGRTLQQASGALRGATKTLPDVMANPAVQRGTTALAVGSSIPPAQNEQNQPSNEQDGNSQQDATSYLNHASNYTTKDIKSQPLPPLTGYSTPTLVQWYADAVKGGDTAGAAKIKQMYDIQSAYEKSQKPKAVSAQTAKDKALASSGMRGVEEVTSMLQKDPSILAKSFLTPGNVLTRKYENAAFRAAEGILRSRSGAVLSKADIENYAKKFLPWFGDDAETIKYKLEQAKMDYNDMRMVFNAEDNPSSSTLPDITAMQ